MLKKARNEQQESYEKANICCISGETFEDKYAKDKKCRKVKDHCRYTDEYRGAHSICNSKDSIPKEITVVFHNRSNYDCHFFIKVLAEKFEGQFMCLGENTEKLTFSVPIQKEFKRIGKNGDEITKTICYKFKFIDGEILSIIS